MALGSVSTLRLQRREIAQRQSQAQAQAQAQAQTRTQADSEALSPPAPSSVSSASSVSFHAPHFRPASFSLHHRPSVSPSRSVQSLRDLDSHGRMAAAAAPTQRIARNMMPASSLPSRGGGGFVLGPPTRSHWKPDSASQACDSCSVRFGILTRRHHCRACGGLFCGPCSPQVARLDQDARPNPSGVLSRVCLSCSAEFDRMAAEELEATLAVAAEHARQRKRREAKMRALESGMIVAQGGSDEDEEGLSERPQRAPRSAGERDGEEDDDGDDDNDDEGEDDEEEDDEITAGNAKGDDVYNGDGKGKETTGTRTAAIKINAKRSGRKAKDDLPPVLSVPSDWSWSTF